ncbi:hornerin [Anopheles aquasalis]|uniref:hornerin n=1 Tax=Anopheles aquasalis TaxID=42839 RepID=UPI00215A4E48|nr:hornerin [Anopheles aquasalis]XP_050082125.1 hornerin [Anopheles aquasalis]XP_050082134.1 hornerin [Anopheles aquasalis]
MKIVAVMLLVALLALAARARPSTGKLDPSDLADIALVEEDVARIKRSGLGSGSGSFDLLGGLKKTILSGIGSASASLVAGSSSSSLSSGSGHGSSGGSSSGHSSAGYGSSGHSYDKPHEESHFDGWSLKKSILNTLFQAVKAITGGVTAIKGQLIKGSGYLVSGAGKLIASGGDAVTGVGKKIALSAHLIPPKHGSSSSHPFTKLLSSSSSGLTATLSHSSSPSSHHSGEQHHSGESYTSYEGPSSYGHDSHGSSGPSGPSYIPPAKSSHKPSLNSYGTELEHHGHGGYSGGKYGHSSDAHHPYGSYEHEHGHSSPVEASDVLREILNQKIPSHGHGPKKVIAQYEIPSDSHPPPFKPMKHGYLPPHSVTHSITTSFGAPAEPAEPAFPSSYDIYRSMSLKHAGHGDPSSSSSSSYPSPRSKLQASVSYELVPPRPGPPADELVLGELTKHLGNGIEVQKSLTYEIADPSQTHLHHKRRSDDDHVDDHTDSEAQSSGVEAQSAPTSTSTSTVT